MTGPQMRGYFGVGVERISKPMNLGAVIRTAHAFGAGFVFTVNAHHRAKSVHQSDTSKGDAHVPYYPFDSYDDLRLPEGCRLVGVELVEDSIDLPSFRHPMAAAYLLGPEKGDLSEEALERCAFVVKIPTRFCVNVSVAAALVMYDRVRSLGRFAPRPVAPGGPLPDDWAPPRR